MREILLSKSSKQNFATIANGEETRWPKKVRRLAIHDFKSDTNQSICCKYLRSLVTFKSKQPLSKSLLYKLLHDGSRKLKVLDLEGTELEEIPKEVFKLFHLKTLSLRHTRVKRIAKAIGSLKNLEYLDLSYTEVRELPKEILKIEGLIHLVVYGSDYIVGFKGPNNIGKLLCLEWLECIEVNEKIIRGIGELKRLKVLGVKSLRREDGKQLCSSLAKLSNLERLNLQAIKGHDQVVEVLDLEDMNTLLCSSLLNLQILILCGRLERVPQVLSLLQGLTLIQLIASRLMDDPLESLQNLPNLREIILDQAFEGESLCFRAGCFLKLEDLRLSRLHSLRWLRVEEGAIPNLGKLNMKGLRLLEEFPWGVQHLAKLQGLYLRDMSEKVMAQLQNQDEESEDYKKISHIPKIMIFDEEDGWCRHLQYGKTRKSSLSSSACK